MISGLDWLRAYLRRYGLAACCIVCPIILAAVTFNAVLDTLLPPEIWSISFTYSPVVAAAKNVNPTQAEAGTDVAKEKIAGMNDVTPDPVLFPIGRQYYGRSNYAIASDFLYLTSVAAFIFSLTVVQQRSGWTGVIVGLLFTSVLVVFTLKIAGVPPGRSLVVDELLNQADNFLPANLIKLSGSGTEVASLVRLNTIVALVPVGMVFFALAALSIRPQDRKLDLNGLNDQLHDLRARLTALRLGLALASAFLVAGVLSNKCLVEWPLTLVIDTQAAALRPVAHALVLQLGAAGSIAIIAAFAPAITAWTLDVACYRARRRAIADNVSAPTSQQATSGDDAETGEKAVDDNLIIAPISVIVAILAALAPVLASPFVDALKSALERFQ